MHRISRSIVIVFCVCIGLVCAPSAFAFPVTWTLSGATFSDGGTATGSFVYDVDTGTLSNWSVSVAGGNTGTFPPITYDTTSGSSSVSGQGSTTTGVMLCISSCNSRELRMPSVSVLTDAGGTIAIDLASGYQGECFNCSPFRAFTAGNLVGTAAPAITSSASTTLAVGTAGTFTVTSTGAPVAALSETGTLPSGVTFADNGDGTAALSGTPGAGTAGTYPVTLTASNGIAPDATQNFTLTISQAPAITSANSATFQNSVASSFTVTTTGFPAPALAMSGTLPAGVTFTDNGNGTATLAGTASTAGTYNLTITASNGTAPDATQPFTLTVQAPAVVVPTPGLTASGTLLLGLLLLLAGLIARAESPRRE
jgi:hypothetical protein